MANNYSQASFVIPVADPAVTRERIEAIVAYLEDRDNALQPTLFGGRGRAEDFEGRLSVDAEALNFGWEIQKETDGVFLWIYDDESIDMEMAVDVCRILLELDGNEEVFTAEWADICDKPRLDSFGGGAVAFSQFGSEWLTTGTAATQLADKLRARR